jgi:hypothetical protein
LSHDFLLLYEREKPLLSFVPGRWRIDSYQGKTAVEKKEKRLGQEWRRAGTEEVSPVRCEEAVNLEEQNKQNIEDDNRSWWGYGQRSIGSADCTEATVLGDGSGSCTTVDM